MLTLKVSIRHIAKLGLIKDGKIGISIERADRIKLLRQLFKSR